MLRLLALLILLVGAAIPASAQSWLPGGTGIPIVCAYNSSPPTVASGGFVYAQCDSGGTLLGVGGGGGGGTSSSFGAAFPATGTAAGFEYLSSPPTLTTGQMVAGQTDINGNLKVNVVTGGGANASVGATGSAVPASATYIGLISGGNLTGWTGSVIQGTAAAVSAAWPTEMVYSLSGTLTAVPGTTYGPDIDCNVSSTLCTLINSAVPAVANAAVDPTAVSDTTNVPVRSDGLGDLVTSANAPRGLIWSASSGATTGTSMTFTTSAKTSYYTYITDITCGRSDTGTTAIIITFNDAATTIIVLPNSGGGGGNNKTFTSPLKLAISTAVTGTVSSGVTTSYCTLSGFYSKN